MNGIGPPGKPGKPNGGTGKPGFNRGPGAPTGPAAGGKFGAPVGEDFGVACFSSEDKKKIFNSGLNPLEIFFFNSRKIFVVWWHS